MKAKPTFLADCVELIDIDLLLEDVLGILRFNEFEVAAGRSSPLRDLEDVLRLRPRRRAL